MTDEQIVKALECCSNMNECKKECPLDDLGGIDKCLPTLMFDALDLIKRQRDEIERLEKGELSKAMTFNSETIKQCTAEAIKEFAQRLRKTLIEDGIYPAFAKNIINNLVKD